MPTANLPSERILILAPAGRDAELSSAALTKAGLTAEVVTDVEALCREIGEGCGAAMITEEALSPAAMQCVREVLEKQPAWSDVPLLIFTSRPSAEVGARSLEALGERANITAIERPIRVKTMVTAAHAALRARRRQYEVRQLVGELERRLEERDQFLAMLSHELRNPLTAISLAVDSIGDATEISKEHAILARQTRHLAKLVDDLLDIARVTTGKITLNLDSVDFADVVEHCAEAARPNAESRYLTLTTQFRVSTAMVRGDAVRLEQVVNNLVSNAIKYTPAGGEIAVHVEVDANDVVLRVTDSGKGIPAEMLPRVFELFTQADTTIDRAEGGMGVGLTLVRRLVELHQGSVRASSAGPGEGSEFVVRLPLAQAAAAARPVASPPPLEAPSRRRILVIEDNEDIRDLLRIKLRQLGHSIDAAEDGTRGLEKLLTSPPEIAIVDIGLPGVDGYEIARKARAAVGSKVYLIALTGYGQAEDREKAIEAGFDVHLTKPPDFTDLQKVLAGAR